MEKSIEIITKKIIDLENNANYWNKKIGLINNTKKEDKKYDKAWSMYVSKITALEDVKKEIERELYRV